MEAVNDAEPRADDAHAGITPFCPYYHRAVELIGRRWSGAIVRAMLSGAERFSDLTAAIPGLSDRLLSERLKELEAEGVVQRTVVPEMPVRIQYHLTEKGRDLASIVDAVSDWAHQWVKDAPEHNDAEGCRAAAMRRSCAGES